MIIKTSLEIDNEKRITSYSYKEKFVFTNGNIIVYRNTTIIPGGEQSHHGRIEENYQLANIQRRCF